MIKRCRRAGLKTMVWTVDDTETAERYNKWGVRDVTTNTLTPGKPQGSLLQRLLWKVRDLFYDMTRLPARFFEGSGEARGC